MKVYQMTFAGSDARTGPVNLGGSISSAALAEVGDVLTSAIVLVAGGAYSVGDIVTSNFYSPINGQLGVGNNGNISFLQAGYDMRGVIILGTFQRD